MSAKSQMDKMEEIMNKDPDMKELIDEFKVNIDLSNIPREQAEMVRWNYLSVLFIGYELHKEGYDSDEYTM